MIPLRHAAALAVAASLSAGGCQCGGPAADPDGGRDGGAGVDGGGGDGGTCLPPLGWPGGFVTTGLDGPRRMAVDDSGIYVTETGALPPGEGRLTRVPLGGGTPLALASSFLSPDAVGLDSQYAYVVDDYGVWRVNKATGQVALLASLAASGAIAGQTDIQVTDQYLVIATGYRWLTRMAKDGTSAVDLYKGASGSAVRGVDVEGGWAYFLVADPATPANGGLYRVALDGGTVPEHLSAEPVGGRSISVSAPEFLWTEGDTAPDGKVRSMSRADGGISELASGLRAPAHAVRVGEAVYFAEQTDPPSISAPADGFLLFAAPCTKAASAVGPLGNGAGDLVWAGGRLYFTSVGISGDGYVGRLGP